MRAVHVLPSCRAAVRDPFFPGVGDIPTFAHITMASALARHLTQSQHLSFDRGIYFTHAFGEAVRALPGHDVEARTGTRPGQRETRLSGMTVGRRARTSRTSSTTGAPRLPQIT